MRFAWNPSIASVLQQRGHNAGGLMLGRSGNFGRYSNLVLGQGKAASGTLGGCGGLLVGDNSDHCNKNGTVRHYSTRSRRFVPRHEQLRSKNFPRRKPTVDIAQTMPLSPVEMDNASLITLGAMGKRDAREEILKRHIMNVDRVSYEEASETFKQIALKNREGMWLLSLPYKIGIGVALTGAYVSIPMVFELNTVKWFNEAYVTADIPEPKDLETWLEVGSWSWNWMEPVLGQISFLLLCLQYSRAQIANMGLRPYTRKVMQMRADKLAAAFPRYDKTVVANFSKSVTFYDDVHGL